MDMKRELRNEFIRTSFVNTADKDYVAARSMWRMRLFDQFYWSGMQAIEKYLKGILLFHDISILGREYGHDVAFLLGRVEQIPNTDWHFPGSVHEIVKHFGERGADRYFGKPTHTKGNELRALDAVVWALRRYCIDSDGLRAAGSMIMGIPVDAYLQYVRTNECYQSSNKLHVIDGGYLEWLILRESKRSPARQALVWKNYRYGTYKKHKMHVDIHVSGKVPMHYFRPEIYPWVKEHVKLDRTTKDYFSSHGSDLPPPPQSVGQVVVSNGKRD